jgi:hypothetical protein
MKFLMVEGRGHSVPIVEEKRLTQLWQAGTPQWAELFHFEDA